MTDVPIITVAVVEDHQLVAEMITSAISEEAGLAVAGTASTGAEARDLAARHRPDVMLMDYRLKEGDGLDAARSVLEVSPLTKIVMLTSADDPDLVRRALEVGCSGFLTKFSELAAVFDAIRRAHAGEVVVPGSLVAQLLERPGHRGGAISRLSARELEVLRLVARGTPSADIAAQLFISANTVRNHVQNIMTKLQARSRLEAVAVAVRRGLIRYD